MGIGRRKFWTVIETKSANSREAIVHIERQGFSTYQPEYRDTPVRGVRKTEPLFPRYLFVRIDVFTWKPLASTRDVRRILMMGSLPAQIQNHEIEHLRSLEDERGYIRPEFAEPPQFTAGQAVAAVRGIFQDKYGTFCGKVGTSGHRVKVMFDMLGRAIEHEISAFDLAATAA